MNTLSLIFSILSALVAVTTLISFFVKVKRDRAESDEKVARRASEEATEETKTSMSLDYIKLQNESIIAGNRGIADKLDHQSARITALETTVANAHLAELPSRLTAVEESVKSAHKRIDRLHSKDEGGI